MALTGQLSDMSLAELIEFFCNQRKTGRLKVDYHRGHGVFFVKDGELVDAKVGALSGAEAVYFALTLPNAAFDFSSEIEPPRRTITERWTFVVLEGLRRLDEGVSPTEADAFAGWTPNSDEQALFKDHLDRQGHEANPSSELFSTLAGRSQGTDGRKKKLMIAGVAASLLLIGLVIAVPLIRSGSKNVSAKTPTAPPVAVAPPSVAPEASALNPVTPTAEAPTGEAPTTETAADDANAADTTDANAEDEAMLAAKREREVRERVKREERQRRDAQLAAQGKTAADAAKVAAATGPKTVRVSVTYDEAGRVTQASVAGASAGAEAFGGTAVRIARGKRFPAGKAGSTIITIPAN